MSTARPPNLVDLATNLSFESERVERTVSSTNRTKFGEAICAFANDLPGHGQPGYLVIGVDDDGTVRGVANANRLLQDLGSLRSDGNILPTPVMSVESLATNDGSTIVVVTVQPSSRPPVRFQGRTWVRVGARKAVATIEEERRLWERDIDGQRTWDMRACQDATLSDLALDLFTLGFLPAAFSPEVIAANGRSVVEQMAALRLFDTRRSQPTNAAMLMFAKDPLAYMPGAYVQFVRYEGLDQASRVLRDRRISGGLQSTLSQLDLLAQDLAGSRPARQHDLRDLNEFEYPPIALHELFMNAVIHRNYDGSTTPVFVSEYADRIEVLNPGSLYGDLSQSGFPGATSYRNPAVAEAAKIMGFVNRFGRGLAIVKDELRQNGSPEASINPQENFFHVTVGRRT